MKRLGKPVAIIIALVILIFSVLSVFGYSYYAGDKKVTVFNGFGSLDWGIDASGGTKIAITPATADELAAVADTLETRAALYGLTEYQLYIDNVNKDVIFVLPVSINSDYTSGEVVSYITSYGQFALRAGDKYTSVFVDSTGGAVFSVPKDETAENCLLTSRYVTGSSTYTYNDYDYIEVKFNEEGASILSDITNPDTGAFYNQKVSIWLDDVMIANPDVTESFEGGEFSFSNEHMTADKAKLISAVISSGTMPCEITVSGYGDIPSALGKGVTELVFWAGVVALLFIAFTLIYKFRVAGVVSVLMLLMQFASILAILTGFVGGGHTFMMTVPGAAAFALSVMLTVFSCYVISAKTKENLTLGTDVDSAIAKGISSAKTLIFDMSFVVAVVSLVGWFVFGTSNFAISLFGNSAAGGICSFCKVMFAGSVLNFITGYVLPQFVLRSLLSFKALSKASMFGGADNEN